MTSRGSMAPARRRERTYTTMREKTRERVHLVPAARAQSRLGGRGARRDDRFGDVVQVDRVLTSRTGSQPASTLCAATARPTFHASSVNSMITWRLVKPSL